LLAPWFLNQAGKCPVDPDVLVDVELKNGKIVIGERADSFYWTMSTSNNQITAYRLHVAEAKESEPLSICQEAFLSSREGVSDASDPAPVGSLDTITPREWRCFHCDEVFTDRDLAADHFGVCETRDAACKLNAMEGGILSLYREAEATLDRYRREDNESFREFYRLGAAHSTALMREEEKGYARGLADGRAESAREAEAVKEPAAMLAARGK